MISKETEGLIFPLRLLTMTTAETRGAFLPAPGLPLPSDFSFTKALKKANRLRYVELVRDLESIQSGSFPHLSI